MARRKGHHGFAVPSTAPSRKFKTVTAADVERQQAERERLMKGTDDMRQALVRPGSLFRLKVDVRPEGPLTALQILVRTLKNEDVKPPGFKKGAVLLFLGRGRANDTAGVNRPVHMFLAMGVAGRFAVHDFELIEVVSVRS